MVPWIWGWLPLVLVLAYAWHWYSSQMLRKRYWAGFVRWFPGDVVKGRWQPTGVVAISTVSVMDPDYVTKFRPYSFGLLAVSTPEALHLALKRHDSLRLRADISVPWDEIQVRPFTATGWPSYGKEGYVELACGEPPIYLQIQGAVLGENVSNARTLPT
jgi:hypothetical protein